MASTIRSTYAAVDIRAEPEGTLWNVSVPELTGAEAERAFRRLYRFAMGSTYAGKTKLATGNRRAVRITWDRVDRLAILNPSKGWREFVHDLSHWFDYLANGSSTHSKFHARLEAKLVREVIARGWLDGRLKDKPKVAEAAPGIDPLTIKRREKLARIEQRIENWQRKAQRAERALAKLAKQQRYYVKALAESAQ